MKINFVVTITADAMTRLRFSTNQLNVGEIQGVGGSDELWDWLNEHGIQHKDVILTVVAGESTEDRLIADAVRVLNNHVNEVIFGAEQGLFDDRVYFYATVQYGGLVRYEISNGTIFYRTDSHDTYTYSEAKKIFNHCVDNGFYNIKDYHE